MYVTRSFPFIFALGLLFLLITACKKESEAAPPKLNGLYRAFPAVPQFGAAIGEAYIFSAGEDVYKGWPGMQLPESFDFVRARSQEPGNTGKYVINGDKIIFNWTNKQSDTASFSFKYDSKTGQTNIAIGPYYCFKVIPWNKTLNDTFEPSTYQGGFSGSNQQTPPLVDAITFTTDGRFTIIGDDKSLPATEGRYKINGLTLTLMMPDNQERIYSLHVYEDHKEPLAAVLINGRPFFAKTK